METGTYQTRSNIVFVRSGRRSAPIYYRNDGGTVLIQYTGGSLSGGVLQTVNAPNWHGSHDIVIDGLTIDGRNLIGGGIFVSRGSHHVTIRNCVIRNTGSSGIALNGTDYVTVEHNLVYHAGYNQGWSSGISLWDGGTSPTYGGSTAWYDTSAGFHNVIVGNIISGSYDNSGYHSDGNGIIVDGSGSIPPALVANNLTYENGGRGVEVHYTSGAVWVVNNTAYADGLDLQVGSGGKAPDFMANYATGVHFINDLAYGRANGSQYTTAYTYNSSNGSVIGWATSMGYNGVTQGISSTVTGDTSKYRHADGLFTSLPAIPSGSAPWASAIAPWSVGNDFTLQPTSPALNAGTNPTNGMTSAEITTAAPYLATNLAGNARTYNTPNIGAY